MNTIRAILYLATLILLALAALGWIPRVPGGFIAAACFVAAFSWPTLVTL